MGERMEFKIPTEVIETDEQKAYSLIQMALMNSYGYNILHKDEQIFVIHLDNFMQVIKIYEFSKALSKRFYYIGVL